MSTMDQSIGLRVAQALPSGISQKEIAQQIGMTEDAFSRALRGQRGFSAIELANLAEVLDADIHLLITGQPDPNRLVPSARHNFDPESRARTVEDAAGDQLVLSDVALAYRQAASVVESVASTIPTDLASTVDALGPSFVRCFIERLAVMGIDVVRLSGLSTTYSLYFGDRAVIVLKETGNWFNENFGLAHELGHLTLGHRGVLASEDQRVTSEEYAANAFAAELLLPRDLMCSVGWSSISAADLASFVWDRGISTATLRNRLDNLGLAITAATRALLSQTTQRLLRHHWVANESGDPITDRMSSASARTFPTWLKDAHLDGIAAGRLQKHTLAWMLGVDADELEVEEPEIEPVGADVLMDILG